MKTNTLTLLALLTAILYGVIACGDKHGHDHAHEGHDHDNEQHEHDGDGHDHDGDDDHEHGTKLAGPNGGRVITNFEPHYEYFVSDDRKVQITFLTDDLKPTDVADQEVRVIAGDRSNPTQLAFAKSGQSLVSDKALPEGDDFPVVIEVKTASDADAVRAKFTMDFSDCPTCDYLEYACTCDH